MTDRSLWHIYLLRCADGSFYCGIARDVAKRLAQHNGLLPGGARYTAGRRPAALLASAARNSRGEALALEAAIKKLPRERKLARLLEAARCQALK